MEKTLSEAELREQKVPWFETQAELMHYIDSLVNREHDYGTCVYAMSMSAVASLQYVAHKLGTTGFQASCADLDIVRRTRMMKGPFMILDIAEALYPQYDLVGKVQESIASSGQWLADKAREKLAEAEGAHPDVVQHWKDLAAKYPPKVEGEA